MLVGRFGVVGVFGGNLSYWEDRYHESVQEVLCGTYKSLCSAWRENGVVPVKRPSVAVKTTRVLEERHDCVLGGGMVLKAWFRANAGSRKETFAL